MPRIDGQLMELSIVPPAGVRQAWPMILSSLKAVMDTGPVEWIPEDVYHALRAGEAACHIATDANGYAGCMVTQRVIDPYSGVQSLHVWIAHNAADADVIEGGMELLRTMAKKGGFQRITFGSARPGWAKRFQILSATYEIPIEG